MRKPRTLHLAAVAVAVATVALTAAVARPAQALPGYKSACSSCHSVAPVGTVTATHLKGALSHYGIPDGSLSASQREVKRWVQREVIASHRLFFQEHLRQRARLPVRLLIDAMFALQTIRLDAVERLSGT